MKSFDFVRVQEIGEAVQHGSAERVSYIAGGTNLVDLMKDAIAQPIKLIDINRLPLREISELEDGGLRLGALATNADTAYDDRVQRRYPILSSAILAGASPQLRNAATNGGNLNQRTRCLYFYDTAAPCNKRQPGSGCGARSGVNRVNAILGASEHCIATHPSDMCVALAVLNATVRVSGVHGERVIPFADYHRLPDDEPWRDTTLEHGDLVTAIDLPAEDFSHNATYLKLRDRQSYAFALVSVAVVMRLEHGSIAEARIALGGVAHKPWRVPEAEALLHGQAPGDDVFSSVADAIVQGAVGYGDNTFKIELAHRAIVRACWQAANGTPQSQTDKRIV